MDRFAGSTILIVDDDPVFRLMLRQFLEQRSFQVCEACDGKEAVACFTREKPQMVLMDAMMPVMNGIDACRQIRDLDRDEACPILMITVEEDEPFIASAFAAGAADYITKPIRWAILEQRMKYKLRISQAVHALQESEARFRLWFQESPLPYQSLDSAGNIVEVNAAWIKMLGYQDDQIIGQPFGNFLYGEDKQKFSTEFPIFKQRGQASDVQFKMLNSDQEVIDVELNSRIAYNIDGSFKQTHCILHDITSRKIMERELKKLATTDPLTGLANRRAFFEESELLRLHCARYHHPFAVMMLDIDLFKLINDTFGHDIGDDVIKLVADIMKQSLREVDILGRIGGEEFAIVLPETTPQHALDIAERIRASIAAVKLETNQGYVEIHISVGVTMMTGNKEGIETLLKQADTLLYQAKQHGRNRVEHDY